VKCRKCHKKAIHFQPYSGAHLCAPHLIEDIERKVKHTIRKHRMIEKGDTIAVALSGGKDSTVLLYLLHKLFSERPDINIIAITIDEGIAGYRPNTLRHAKEITSKLGIEHIIASFKDEYGSTLDQIVAKGGREGTVQLLRCTSQAPAQQDSPRERCHTAGCGSQPGRRSPDRAHEPAARGRGTHGQDGTSLRAARAYTALKTTARYSRTGSSALCHFRRPAC